MVWELEIVVYRSENNATGRKSLNTKEEEDKYINTNSKPQIYKTVGRPVLTYAMETRADAPNIYENTETNTLNDTKRVIEQNTKSQLEETSRKTTEGIARLLHFGRDLV